MPSGAKKRKAVKRKMKKGEVYKNSDNNSNNSSSTHSQGSDDVRSIDERESDFAVSKRGGEGEKGETVAQVAAVDRDGENGSSKGGDRLEEQGVEIERESKPPEGNPIGGGDPCDGAQVVQNGISATIDDRVPSNGGPEEKEVKVKPEEEPVIAESGKEYRGREEYSSLSEKVALDETMKPADYMPEETIGATGAIVEQVHNLLEKRSPIVESVKKEILSSQEANLTTRIASGEVSVKSGSVESDLRSNEEGLFLSHEKSSSAVVDSQLEKIEVKVVPIENESFDKPSNIGKENDDKLLNSLASPAVDSSSRGVDDIKDLVAQQNSEKKVVVPAVETSRDVECVKNGKTVKHSDEALVFSTSCGVDNAKDLNNSKHSKDEPLIGSTPMPVRRTSWMGCCGLFEVFAGSR